MAALYKVEWELARVGLESWGGAFWGLSSTVRNWSDTMVRNLHLGIMRGDGDLLEHRE